MSGAGNHYSVDGIDTDADAPDRWPSADDVHVVGEAVEQGGGADE